MSATYLLGLLADALPPDLPPPRRRLPRRHPSSRQQHAGRHRLLPTVQSTSASAPAPPTPATPTASSGPMATASTAGFLVV